MPSVSVIIPTYNRASVVVHAVNSVLAQRDICPELIVVDDGSTDETRNALAPVIDRIKYIYVENGGVSAARNRGIREASGDWIAFLDSDDLWHPDKLHRQMSCVGDTGAKVCFCVSMAESGDPIDDLRLMDPTLEDDAYRGYSAGDLRMLAHPRHGLLPSMLVERKALLAVGSFDETLWVAEDTRLIYRLVLDYDYAIVNSKLVEICRSRSEPGLSDRADATSAARRHECYMRVQSEFFWRLVAVDRKIANVFRRRMYYFCSRYAEILCALDRRECAQNYARVGIDLRAGWKCFIRNCAIWFAYPLVRRRFARKWGVTEIVGDRTAEQGPRWGKPA
jgi:glycosyltransferase involved in cell wall biosynthesis